MARLEDIIQQCKDLKNVLADHLDSEEGSYDATEMDTLTEALDAIEDALDCMQDVME